jgi:uncharacterized protein (TIGR02117 family)
MPMARAGIAALALLLPALFPPALAAADVDVYVVSNGWHTEIAVPRAAIPDGAIPEAADFPRATFLVFGWGHAEYYPHPDPGWGLTLGAALIPSPAVMHLIGLDIDPRQAYRHIDVAPVTLDADGWRKLIRHVNAAFARGGAPRAAPVAKGLYDFSLFYPAVGTFLGLSNNCNTWTAAALAAAGLRIDPEGVFRANDVMYRVRGLTAR